MACRACDTGTRSRYEPGPFDRLDAERRRFALLFLGAGGNLREMERLLGVSNPAVRRRLDERVEAPGGAAAAGADRPGADAVAGNHGDREEGEAT